MIVLKELRKETGITLDNLSKEIGYSGAIISEWERGLAQPTASALIKLAQFYEVTIDYLLGLDENGYVVSTPREIINIQLDHTSSAILEKLKKLNTLGKQKTENYIDDLIASGKYKS